KSMYTLCSQYIKSLCPFPAHLSFNILALWSILPHALWVSSGLCTAAVSYGLHASASTKKPQGGKWRKKYLFEMEEYPKIRSIGLRPCAINTARYGMVFWKGL